MSGEKFDGYGGFKALSVDSTPEDCRKLYVAWSETYDEVCIAAIPLQYQVQFESSEWPEWVVGSLRQILPFAFDSLSRINVSNVYTRLNANRKIAVFVDKIPMGFAENIMLQSRGSNRNLTHFNIQH